MCQYENLKYEQLLFGNTEQNFILEIVSASLTRIGVPICNSGFGSCIFLTCSNTLCLDFLVWRVGKTKVGKEISYGRVKQYKAAKSYIKGKTWREGKVRATTSSRVREGQRGRANLFRKLWCCSHEYLIRTNGCKIRVCRTARIGVHVNSFMLYSDQWFVLMYTYFYVI